MIQGLIGSVVIAACWTLAAFHLRNVLVSRHEK
jgi:hypothetical protein